MSKLPLSQSIVLTTGTRPVDRRRDDQRAVVDSVFLAVGDWRSQGRNLAGGEFRGKGVRSQNSEDNPKSKIENPKSNRPLPERPRAAEVLIIDDVDGWLGKPGNVLPAAMLARIIQRLNALARRLRVAIVVLTSTQPSVEGRITSRQLSRLSQVASVVWMIVKEREEVTGDREQGKGEEPEVRSQKSEDNPKSKIENPKSADGLGRPSSQEDERRSRRAYCQNLRRWFMPVKNNLARDAETFGRSFELVDGQLRWHADDPAPTLAEALLPSVHNTDRRRERNDARAWIERALADGPLPSDVFYQQGIDCGFSKGTLRRAASELGIHSRKIGLSIMRG